MTPSLQTESLRPEPATAFTEAQAQHVALAMRQVSRADGEIDEELALIDEFVSCLQGPAPERVDWSLFDTREHRLLFLRHTVLVALADGEISLPEMAVLDGQVVHLGLDREDLDVQVHDVKRTLLSSLAGVHVFLDQAMAVGRSLGLADDEIREILGS